jgi:hypothetical protein
MKRYNSVWEEIHASPTFYGVRNFQCQHCFAYKSTKRNIPTSCEFCGRKVMSNG